MALKWEFPGGKVEPGEGREECLIREIREELSVNVDIIRGLSPVKHHYPDLSLTLYPFLCTISGAKISLNVHKTVLWVRPEKLLDHDWAEADIPIVREYQRLKKIQWF